MPINLENSLVATRLEKVSFHSNPKEEQCQRMSKLLYCCCCCIASVMSNSVKPHRQQPTGLPCPGDSPGKNTGVGCHFLLQNYCTVVLISHASKVKFIILQARLQQYMNWELPDGQAGFTKGRGTKNQNDNICWVIEKAREFQKDMFLLHWLC